MVAKDEENDGKAGGNSSDREEDEEGEKVVEWCRFDVHEVGGGAFNKRTRRQSVTRVRKITGRDGELHSP